MKFLSKLIILCLLSGLQPTALAATNEDENKYNYNYSELNNKCQVYDPYEGLNRVIFNFNGVFDTFLLRPFAKGYQRFTNNYTKNRVESFVDNIRTPLTTVNYLLQGEGLKAHESFWQFIINSTIGIAGLFDVAGKIGLNPEPQTFGSTLAAYGVGSGPYIVLPLFGGMSARDVTDPLFTNDRLNVLEWHIPKNAGYGITGARIIHYRAKILPFTDYVTKNSPDPYIAIRNATLQERENKVSYPANFRCPKVN